jgi:HEAT repeat protein
MVATEVIARCGITAVPVLVERLSDERVEARRWAAKALGAIGPEAQEANTPLRRLLSDPDQTVREEAKRALAILNIDGLD